MILSRRQPPEEKQKLLSSQEVYSLWDLLKTKYYEFETLNLYITFIHDMDFKLVLQNHLKEVKTEIKDLEGLVKKFAIEAPPPKRKDISSSINTEIITDSYMGSTIMLLYQELIEMKLRAFRTSTTNDNVRQIFKQYSKKAIKKFGFFVKYLKAKGWIDIPAIYPTIPAGTKEQIDAGEAFHLWDHLTFRYLNIELTQIFLEFANDSDFKIMLKQGIQNVLKKDANKLEKELKHFGIPFPEASKEIYENLGAVPIPDKFMFQQLLSGMGTAAVLHAQAIKQSTTNDRIRELFNDLLIREIEVIDNVFLFGKTKGWLNNSPRFSNIQ